MNLLGRDLLVKIGATILCTPDGLILHLPGHAPTTYQHGQRILMMGVCNEPEVPEETTKVYWSRLLTTGLDTPEIQWTYMKWKPWINTLGPYGPPLDPLHCTYNYLRRPDEEYQQAWEEDKEKQTENIEITDIYVGPQGVAAHCKLTPEQLSWYALPNESEPHVTLAVAVGHEARSLGPMLKRAITLDWQPTSSPILFASSDGTMWKILH